MKGVMLFEYAYDTARLAHVAGLVNFYITTKKLDAFHPYLAAVIKRACALVPDEGPGILIFVSALNLLLFSPTYGKGILVKLKATAQGKKQHTHLFSASTMAKAEKIAELETVVDNLIMTHSTKDPFRLYMQIERIKETVFVPSENEVPFSADLLTGVKEIADHSRKRVIPLVSKL